MAKRVDELRRGGRLFTLGPTWQNMAWFTAGVILTTLCFIAWLAGALDHTTR